MHAKKVTILMGLFNVALVSILPFIVVSMLLKKFNLSYQVVPWLAVIFMGFYGLGLIMGFTSLFMLVNKGDS